jgi:hypothetical protein
MIIVDESSLGINGLEDKKSHENVSARSCIFASRIEVGGFHSVSLKR